MADIRGKKILVIGGAGFIGSHVVDELLKEDVEEVIVYDNFARGARGNLDDALTDSRVRIFEVGGDILHTDVLSAAVLPRADGAHRTRGGIGAIGDTLCLASSFLIGLRAAQLHY